MITIKIDGIMAPLLRKFGKLYGVNPDIKRKLKVKKNTAKQKKSVKKK